jgi:hypothetical protein
MSYLAIIGEHDSANDTDQHALDQFYQTLRYVIFYTKTDARMGGRGVSSYWANLVLPIFQIFIGFLLNLLFCGFTNCCSRIF